MIGTKPRGSDHIPNVVFVLRRLDIGGTEKHISLVLPELWRPGIDASLYLLERGGKLETALEANGVSIFGPKGASGSIIQRLCGVFELSSHLRRQRPDIVHFFLPEAYLIGTLAALLAGVKIRIMSRRSLAHYRMRHPMAPTISPPASRINWPPPSRNMGPSASSLNVCMNSGYSLAFCSTSRECRPSASEVHARGLAHSHGDEVRALIGRVALIELVPSVLARALEPFPVAVRTLDALHLSAIEFLRSRRQTVKLVD